MSQNIKHTRYTITSYPYNSERHVAVFGDFAIPQMIRYVRQENKLKIYMHVTKETITLNYHISKDKFPWLNSQEVKKADFRVENYCRIGEPKSPNAGFFEFIGYQH